MLNRWAGITLAAFMLVANGVIVFRDIVPMYLTGDPPKSMATTVASGKDENVQVGIFNEQERLMGRAWTTCRRSSGSEIVYVDSITVLEPIALPTGVTTPRVRIETSLTYKLPDARVDSLQFSVHGLPDTAVSLKGENMPSNEFPCIWQVGRESGRFIIPSELTRALGDAIKPFDRLPELYVGRVWQLKLLNPVDLLTPGIKATDQLDMQTILVRCSGSETLRVDGRDVETFVVEAPGVKANATRDGRVLRQEVHLPFLGTLILKDEPFDGSLRDETKKLVPSTNR